MSEKPDDLIRNMPPEAIAAYERSMAGYEARYKDAAEKWTIYNAHATACVVAIEEHCGGDPTKVGQLRDALKQILDYDDIDILAEDGLPHRLTKLARAALGKET